MRVKKLKKKLTINHLHNPKGQALELVNHIKDFGVIFDSKLSFKEQIEYLELKVKKKIYFVKRFSRKFSGIVKFRILYFFYMYSVIMYASPI